MLTKQFFYSWYIVLITKYKTKYKAISTNQLIESISITYLKSISSKNFAKKIKGLKTPIIKRLKIKFSGKSRYIIENNVAIGTEITTMGIDIKPFNEKKPK